MKNGIRSESEPARGRSATRASAPWRRGLMVALLLTALSATGAFATEIIVTNEMSNDVNMAFLYFDSSSGLWTTKGWYSVDGGGQRTINFKVIDKSKGVYYAAFSGNTSYVDSSTLERDRVTRWISDERFEFDFKEKPANGKNLRIAPFYRCRYSEGAGAFIVRIDTRPKG